MMAWHDTACPAQKILSAAHMIAACTFAETLTLKGGTQGLWLPLPPLLRLGPLTWLASVGRSMLSCRLEKRSGTG